MGCGHSTNTISKLLARWALLYFTRALGLPTLNVFEDCSSIINWAMKKATLTMLNLEGWCHNICELRNYFLSLHFLHVYREYNKRADKLSKEALTFPAGFLTFTKFFDGERIGNGTF